MSSKEEDLYSQHLSHQAAICDSVVILFVHPLGLEVDEHGVPTLTGAALNAAARRIYHKEERKGNLPDFREVMGFSQGLVSLNLDTNQVVDRMTLFVMQNSHPQE